MNTWLESILEGIRIYVNYAMPVTITIMAMMMLISKRFNLAELFVKQMFVMYLCCVTELVFFPLPTVEQAASLNVQCQLIPMHFLADYLNDSFINVTCQIVFNVVMTIPLGMYLEYCAGLSIRKTLLIGFAFTAFIELGQLTGLFFIFKGSYRLCDVDDLTMNTLGTLIGYLAMRRIDDRLIPAIGTFDRAIGLKDIRTLAD